MNIFDILPAQPDPRHGWTIEFSFLEAVAKAAEAHGENLCLEEIEAVLLGLFDVLPAYCPNGLRGR